MPKEKPKTISKTAKKMKPLKVPKDGGPILLKGGNPQIAKADGDAPVQAYIAAMHLLSKVAASLTHMDESRSAYDTKPRR